MDFTCLGGTLGIPETKVQQSWDARDLHQPLAYEKSNIDIIKSHPIYRNHTNSSGYSSTRWSHEAFDNIVAAYGL